MASKRKPSRGLYLVAEDYATTDLDGRGGVAWGAGAVVELDGTAAEWVNSDRPGTLEDYREAADPELDEDGD